MTHLKLRKSTKIKHLAVLKGIYFRMQSGEAVHVTNALVAAGIDHGICPNMTRAGVLKKTGRRSWKWVAGEPTLEMVEKIHASTKEALAPAQVPIPPVMETLMLPAPQEEAPAPRQPQQLDLFARVEALEAWKRETEAWKNQVEDTLAEFQILVAEFKGTQAGMDQKLDQLLERIPG